MLPAGEEVVNGNSVQPSREHPRFERRSGISRKGSRSFNARSGSRTSSKSSLPSKASYDSMNTVRHDIKNDVKKAAAAVAVGVGSFEDPDDLQERLLLLAIYFVSFRFGRVLLSTHVEILASYCRG
jgi:hypothetical protein